MSKICCDEINPCERHSSTQRSADSFSAGFLEHFDSKAQEITDLLYAWKNDEIKTSSETAHQLRSILLQGLPHFESTVRRSIATEMEQEITPLLEKEPMDGGYNCCGCGSYHDILSHAMAITVGEDYS